MERVQKYPVEVQSDFLERQSNAQPIPALAELIWNSLDADSTWVRIELEDDELQLRKIIIKDNGHGIPHKKAHTLFSKLGGSWKKRESRSKTKERLLHGQEGKGRFKALSLGNVAIWNVSYKENGTTNSYSIRMMKSNVREVEISNEVTTPDKNSGVRVEITEPWKNFQSLRPEHSVQALTEIFALYLKNYSKVEISIGGKRIDPNLVIENTKKVILPEIKDDGEVHSCELEIIEWKTNTERTLYLCNEDGFTLSKTSSKFQVGNHSFSAYLKSSFISKLHNEGLLEIGELNPLLNASIESARQEIKGHFRERDAEQFQTIVEEWKKEEIYPYAGNPQNQIEKAERQVFDIVAVNVSEYLPNFSESTKTNRAWNLRLLRQAIEKSPNDLQLILKEVLDLPKRKQEELASLLKETTLSAIINASKIVSDRLRFIKALESVVFVKDYKKNLKERSQLHRIIADNTWIFGEEFNLSVDDRSLTEVLRQHKKILREDISIDEPVKVKRIDGKTGIVDLMLSRSIHRYKAEKIEHLVIELKAPTVKIGSDELTQIKKYAFTVSKDERFRTLGKVKWYFWILSNDLDDFGKMEADEDSKVYSQNNIVIYAKTWGQIIAENKARLQFFQEKLEYQADQGKALKDFQKKYSEFLKGVIDNEGKASQE